MTCVLGASVVSCWTIYSMSIGCESVCVVDTRHSRAGLGNIQGVEFLPKKTAQGKTKVLERWLSD